MKNLLREAGREFLKVFVVSILIFAPGVLSATNLNDAYGLGVAALGASVTAGVKAIQVYFPRLTFAGLFPQPYAALTDAFSRAFLGAFSVGVIGVLDAPNLATAKALLVSAIVGAAATGARAVEGLLTKGETPFRSVGFDAN